MRHFSRNPLLCLCFWAKKKVIPVWKDQGSVQFPFLFELSRQLVALKVELEQAYGMFGHFFSQQMTLSSHVI